MVRAKLAVLTGTRPSAVGGLLCYSRLAVALAPVDEPRREPWIGPGTGHVHSLDVLAGRPGSPVTYSVGTRLH